MTLVLSLQTGGHRVSARGGSVTQLGEDWGLGAGRGLCRREAGVARILLPVCQPEEDAVSQGCRLSSWLYSSSIVVFDVGVGKATHL